MAERLKAPVLKTGKGATLSWVRIPVLPPLIKTSYNFYNGTNTTVDFEKNNINNLFKNYKFIDQ